MYMNARKTISYDIMKNNMDTWNETLRQNDAEGFWKYVDWKGNYNSKKQVNYPSVKQFECFFQELYDTADQGRNS